MRVISNIGRLKNIKGVVLVIGVFDGLHRGHQALIKKALLRARALKTKLVVMTFYPHPVHVLHPEVNLPYIASLSQRLKLLEELGVFLCLVIKFTKRFARLSPERFIKRYLLKYFHPQEVYVGDDFRFGQDRQGTIEYFCQMGERHGFKVNHIIPVKGGRGKISSTDIRRLITAGKLARAAQFLGRRVSLMGRVEKGDGRGKGLGFPTANIYPRNHVLPPGGVYAVYAAIGRRQFKGMANIGKRPSFYSPLKSVNLEVHLFDFHQNLYGREIVVEFVKKVREERPFAAREELTFQLKQDEVLVKAILRRKKIE